MDRTTVVELLGSLREFSNAFEKARRLHNADVAAASRRLVLEAARLRMTSDQIAEISHLTEHNVRSIMRNEGVDPRRGVNQIAKQAGQILSDNAALMGLDVAQMDLMSPLAYLPAGDVMKRAIQDKTVSQVDEIPFDWKGWIEEHEQDPGNLVGPVVLVSRLQDALDEAGL